MPAYQAEKSRSQPNSRIWLTVEVTIAASRPKRSRAKAKMAKASALTGKSTQGVVLPMAVAKVMIATNNVPAIQSLRNTRRSRKSMKKNSIAVKMAEGIA